MQVKNVCDGKHSVLIHSLWYLSLSGLVMALKRRRTASPTSSLSGGDFEDSQTSSIISSIGRKRRRTSNLPTVDPVYLTDFRQI